MLASASPRMVEMLDAADERQTAKVIFVDLASLNFERLSFALCSELEPIGTDAIIKRVAVIIQELKKGTNYSTKVVSLFAERLFESMISRGFKSEHMELAYVIGEEVLKMLKQDHQAIRRLRSVYKLINVVSADLQDPITVDAFDQLFWNEARGLRPVGEEGQVGNR